MKFTNEELQVLNDRKFFDLKHSSTKKIVEIFGGLEVRLKELYNSSGLSVSGLNSSSGKIFRGENYRSYPYILLDCPRQFNKESVFAFRTMLWWGNEFTFTLHLQGNALEQFRSGLIANIDSLYDREILFCVNESPWQYHLNEDNYVSLDIEHNRVLANELLKEKDFIKLCKRLPINAYERAEATALDTFRSYLEVLKN